MNNKRPIGIIILGLFLIIIGLLGVNYLLRVPEVIKNIPKLVLWIVWTSSFLITGIGILRLKKWARISAIVLVAIKTIQVTFGSVKDMRTLINISSDPSSIYIIAGITVFLVILGGAAIYYLSTSKIKEQLIH